MTETSTETPVDTPDDSAQVETFDADYVKKLRQESAKYRTEAKVNADAAKRLAEIENASKSEQERAAEQQQQAVSRATAAEARAMRLEVAFEKGLTPAQAKRLVGSTRDELEADADEVLKDFPAGVVAEPRRGVADQGVRRGVPAQTPAEAFKDWLGSQK